MYNQPVQQQSNIPGHLLYQGLPYRLPFTLNLQLRPMMQPHLKLLIGYALAMIQGHAQKNIAREALFWKMVGQLQPYQNGDFCELVSSIADYAELLIQPQQAFENNPEGAIRAAAEELCAILASFEAKAHQSIYLSLDAASQQQVEQNIRQFQQIGSWIMSFQQVNTGGYNQNQNYNPHLAAQTNQGGRYGGAGYESGVDPRFANAQAPAYQQQPSRGQGNSVGVPYVQPSRTPYGNGAPAMPNNPIHRDRKGSLRANAFGPAAQVVEEISWDNSPADITPPAPATGPGAEALFTVKSDAGLKTYVAEKDMAGFKFPFNPSCPYRFVYDPMKHNLFYQLTDKGFWVEVFFENKEEIAVNYADHETQQFFNPVSKADANRARDLVKGAAEFTKILHMRDVEQLVKDYTEARSEDLVDGEIDLSTVDTAVAVPDIIYSETFDAISVMSDLDIIQCTNASKGTVNLTYCVYDPIPLIDDAAIAVEELANSPDMRVLAKRLAVVQTKVSPRHWVKIHKAITEHVNEIVHIGLQIPRPAPGQNIITSALDDMEELISWIEKNFGAEILEKFMLAAKEVGRSSATTTEDPDLIADHIPKEFHSATYKRVLVTFVNATLIQAHSADISLRCVGNQGMVMESFNPELFHAIRLIFSKFVRKETRYVKIVTIDGRELFLFRGLLGNDCHLVGWERNN